MTPGLRLVLLVALLGAARVAAGDVHLDLGSATVAHPGDTGRLCVSLDTGGAEVAGTQNDLVWDGSCAALPSESACAVAGTHGKELHSRIQSSDDFRLRALVLSLSDVDPIDDGVLYCCDFTVESAPGTCCHVTVTDAGASDSKGDSVAVNGGTGQLCVGGSGGGASSTPTAGPSANDDDGCQLAPAHGTTAAPLLAALAIFLLRRRR